MNGPRPSPAARVALLYAATALSWIVGSDYVLQWATGLAHEITVVSVAKGVGFVLLTSLLLFEVLRRLWAKESEARAAAEATARQLRELQVIAEHDLTQRKLAEEALRENEEKLRALYDSMNEGLALHELVHDTQGHPVDYRILDLNPAFESILGRSREQVVGTLASAVYGCTPPPGLEVYAQVTGSGQPAAFETYFAPLERHFAVSVFSPRKGQFATVFTDVTKRKEAERQICLLNQVYALLSHINEAIVRVSDPESLFQEACRIATEQGRFRMAWIGVVDPATRSLRPAAWAGHEAGYLQALQASGQDWGIVTTALNEARVLVATDLQAPAQEGLWREAARSRGYGSCMALPLKLGPQVLAVLAVYSEEADFFNLIVTDALIEVAADLSFALELFERTRQREQEQQQLRLQQSALEAAANAIMITDRSGTIQWVNEAFTRLTGYSCQEAVGQTPRLLRSGIHQAEFYHRMWEVMLGGAVWHGEVTNRRKEGTCYEEEMTITPVRSASGEISHFIAIKQDVTERRKLEQQFLRAQRMQSIGLLAGGVAHDLNNVLAPVLMALPLLRTDPTPEQRNQIIDTLEKSVHRGANIVRQVLTFARGVEVQRTTMQLRHLLREVAKIAEETFPRDIEVRSSVPPDLWPLVGDPTQIHQVLLNLAVNARDAMPDGGQLTLAARNLDLRAPLQFMDFEIPPGRYTALSVADTGTGMEPKVLERIFEPFFTTKPAGKGTGLGLSTVLGIVKSHGGLVEVQTKVGAGSTFTVFLPASPTAAATSQPARPALPQGRGETILVVDDEAGVLQVTRSILLGNGYKVVTAREGMQALARYTEHRQGISAVVTDIMMPFMDGLALTSELRQMSRSLPVVVTTGLTNPPGEADRTEQLLALGVSQILRKPFAAEELLRALRTALDQNGRAAAPELQR